MNYQFRFHCGHMDIKGMVGDFILGQTKWHDERRRDHPELETTCMGAAMFTTGPYLDMCVSAHTPVAPQIAGDGVVEWRLPCTVDGKMPIIALDDCGKYVRWLLDNGVGADGKPGRAWGMDLAVVTEHVTFPALAAAFQSATGHPARFVPVTVKEYFEYLDPVRGHKFGQGYCGMPDDDGSLMTFEQNFSGWWQIYGTEGVIKRDFALLDEILPDRIKTVGEWFAKHPDLCERVTKGEHLVVLKLQEDGDRFNKKFDVRGSDAKKDAT